MKKKIISLLSALALTAQIVPCALADNDVKVYVNDTEMITDAPIIIENDRTLVPVRAISEYLDYTVDWDNDTQTVIISKNLTTLKFTIDNLEAILEFIFYEETVDGKVHLEVAPQIINDTTYIPLSDFKSAFHVNIDWDDDNKEVHIASYKQGDFSQLIKFGIISDDDLNNFMTQAYNICNDFNATGKVIFFDSIVQDIFDIDKDNFKKARPTGGEGTNVDSAFSYIRDKKLKYICAVVLTDGYFPRPNILIRNVIWCLTEDATTRNIEGYKGSKIIKM